MTRLTVSFERRLVGLVALDSSRRLVFPTLPEAPGLYQFSVEDQGGSSGVYVGETDTLRRRAQHNRTPGARQPTNLRSNAELAEALGRGVRVGVAVVTAATLDLDDASPRALKLDLKSNRLIVENAAIAAIGAACDESPGSAPHPLNRPGVGEDAWG